MSSSSQDTGLSNCCGKPVRVETDLENGLGGTSYYVCTGCERACDPVAPDQNTEKPDRVVITIKGKERTSKLRFKREIDMRMAAEIITYIGFNQGA